MQSITLLIPGLIWPFNKLEVEEVPRFQALDTLISRSNKYILEDGGYYTQLCDRFGLESDLSSDLPLAALSRLIDDAGHPEGYWLRADPVYLETIRDGLCLYDSSRFNLSQSDALLYGALLKNIFDDQSWHFEVPEANRWYLQFNEDPGLATTDISRVRGKDVQLYMPAGSGKSTMERLLTEIQMTLHECDFNLERESKGERPINSVWFWGGGSLPEILPRKWDCLVSNDAVAQGLSILSSTAYLPLQNNKEDIDLSQDGDVIIVRDDLMAQVSYQDYRGWYESMEHLEINYFAPLLEAITQQQVHGITISTGEREFEIHKSCLGKFWRRIKPLSSFC